MFCNPLFLSFLVFLGFPTVALLISLIGSIYLEKSWIAIAFTANDLAGFFLLDDTSLMSLIGVFLPLCSILESQKDEPNLFGVVFAELFFRSLSYFSTDTYFCFSRIISKRFFFS